MPLIYVDADACPVKNEVYKVAERHEIEVVVVANSWMNVPARGSVRLQLVSDGFDAADDWIAERAGEGDVVVTSDVPLAARCIKAGAAVLGNDGREFTEAAIGHVLATRDILTELRSAGETTRGPRPLQARDRSRFLQELDRLLRAGRRRPPL